MTLSFAPALAAIALLATGPATQKTLMPFSSADTEVRIALAPDGKRALWGHIGAPDDPQGWQILESVKTAAGWSAPKPVSFNSAQNDFDPFISADGRSVLFFSNRPGGQGGDDLWSVSLDPKTGAYGAPRNLGPAINTAKDEWAPALSADGKSLLFASDGHGGQGRQDLFIAERQGDGWSAPANLGPGVNTAKDEFDATFLPGGGRLIYTHGDLEADGGVRLAMAEKTAAGWVARGDLGPEINCSAEINNGPAVSAAAPGELFWSAKCEGGKGRMDLWRAALPTNP